LQCALIIEQFLQNY